MDAIANVTSDGWFCVSSVNDALIALDRDVDVFDTKTAPKLFDEGDEGFTDSEWDVIAAFEMFAEIVAVFRLVKLESDEIWVEILVC
jgi:hypothetical protein